MGLKLSTRSFVRSLLVAVLGSFIALLYFGSGDRTSLVESGIRLGSGKMFDRIAHYYDTANSVMSLGQPGK